MFHGSIVALLTPFKNGKVDEAAFQSFVEWQVSQGTHGLVPCGTTGESATMSHEEHNRVVELCIEAAGGRIPTIAVTGSNSTEEAIGLTRHAKKAGAQAALVVTPYYNKPTQEGLYQHFKAIHDAADLPIIIYNIPGRSVVDMSIATMARLAKLPNIVGVKDATADLARPARLRLEVGETFAQLSGEDVTALAFNAQGGVGCISVSANVAPGLCAAMQNAWREGDYAAAYALRDRLTPLHDSMFVETNPVPVKYALSLLGKCGEEVRLPMVPLSDSGKATVRGAMTKAGLLT
jgi:4-hydroxy-tetrahydrodipicolinate synthase